MANTAVQQTEIKTINRYTEHFVTDQLLSREVGVVKIMTIINVHRHHAILMMQLQLLPQLLPQLQLQHLLFHQFKV